MLAKAIEENLEEFVNCFVNACILGCKVSFGVLVYHTLLLLLFSSHNCIFLWKVKMAQSFANKNMISKNSCEVFMNDVMEEKCLLECEINPSQTKGNQNLKSEKNNERKHF